MNLLSVYQLYFSRKELSSSGSRGTIMLMKLRYVPVREEIQEPQLELPSSLLEKTGLAV